MPSTSPSGGGQAVLKPTKWRWDTGTGRLQKQDPGSTAWDNFTIKGINYSLTPPGWSPEYPFRAYNATNNIATCKKFSEIFAAMGGNTYRIYVNLYGASFQTGGPGTNYNKTDPVLLLKFLDECYKKKIYCLIDVYVNFAYNSSGADRYQYRTECTDQMMQVVALTKDHPAVLGYPFGNETNISYSLVNETLAAWYKLANDTAKEVYTLDNGNHLFGPCDIMGQGVINAENAGLLNACNVHFFNAYPNPQWNENSGVNNNGAFSNWRSQITNGKKFVITETGYSSWNGVTNTDDWANHALFTGQLYDNFLKPPAPQNGGGQDVCGGILFFAAADEQFKGGPYLNGVQVNGSVIQNDGNYTNVYGHDESWDLTNPASPVRKNPIPTVGYINPIGNGKFYEQRFGWFLFTDGNLTATPLVPKTVVATMTQKWTI
jgi:hypothetical protein